jgi:hypothetical protein
VFKIKSQLTERIGWKSELYLRAGDFMDGNQADAVLRLFVRTGDAVDSERLLSELITAHAAPVISKIVRYKTRGDSREADAEDIRSEVVLQLIGRLQRLRASDNDGNSIADFNSYVAVSTYNACDRYLSRKYPNRRRLKNGLRYLLTHRAGFNCWQDERGNFVGGFARWQFGSENRPAEADANLKLQQLREDSGAFARAGKVSPAWNDQKQAYELLNAIFEWTNAPIDLDLLVAVVAEWWNITDEIVELDSAFDRENEKNTGVQMADARADVTIETERRVYLQMLWEEIIALPPRQRAAVLLNLRDETGRGVIDLWLITGVATVEKIAAALETTREAFAALWNDLPLDDNQIAARLNLTRQQIINLRKSARERLSRRMKGF